MPLRNVSTSILSLDAIHSRAQRPRSFWSAPSLRSKRFCAVREPTVLFLALAPFSAQAKYRSPKTPFLGLSLLPNSTETLATPSSQHQESRPLAEAEVTILGADQKERGLWGREWTPLKPSHACAVKPEVLKSWSLEIDYSRASQRSNDWAFA